jgi:hypothetical protein
MILSRWPVFLATLVTAGSLGMILLTLLVGPRINALAARVEMLEREKGFTDATARIRQAAGLIV